MDPVRPVGLKLVLALTLIIPALFLVLTATALTLDEPLLPVAIAVAVACSLAWAIDRFIRSRTTKIAIAAAAAIASILLGQILVRGMTLVCDPVHEPGIVCDPVHVPDTTTAPTVIATIQPSGTTPMIFDPVHEPGGCSDEICRVAPVIAASVVEQKLEECLKKL